ncbi:MAG: hypothetical protein JG781_2368 [Peptococcaceae bacterium]|jgi:nitrogenase molybdenum-iron protein alpha/beta subunit|nr:hypothetical protein [Peptococcaceae bacterium]
MKTTWKLIPPFASDYSGVCSVLYELNSLIILFSPGGCSHSIVETDEIRSFNIATIFSSSLNDIDVIMGAEDRFITNAIYLIKNHPGVDFVSILGTPVSAITGVNFNRIARELQEKTGLPVVVFNTNGFESYVSGIYDALLKLGETFMVDSGKKNNRINILGYSPLNIGNKAHLNELISALESKGFEVMIFPGAGIFMKEIKRASESILNLVISPEGLGLAEYMQMRFEVPYLMQLPVGINGMIVLLHEIERRTGIEFGDYIKAEYTIDCSVKFNTASDTKVLILGQPLLSVAVGECLKMDFGIEKVSIATHLKRKSMVGHIYSNSMFSNVNFFEDEDDVINCMHGMDIIIADPLYRKIICEGGERTIFIPLPHIGLSGRKFADLGYEYIGRGGFAYIKSYIVP